MRRAEVERGRKGCHAKRCFLRVRQPHRPQHLPALQRAATHQYLCLNRTLLWSLMNLWGEKMAA